MKTVRIVFIYQTSVEKDHSVEMYGLKDLEGCCRHWKLLIDHRDGKQARVRVIGFSPYLGMFITACPITRSKRVLRPAN